MLAAVPTLSADPSFQVNDPVRVILDDGLSAAPPEQNRKVKLMLVAIWFFLRIQD